MADNPAPVDQVRQGLSLCEADAGDLDSLADIEALSFSSDRLSRRSFARHIGSRNAAVIVARSLSEIAGYALVLFRSNSRIARLYSLAVAPAFAGQSVGRMLLCEAQRVAHLRGADRLRLEVRTDNNRARSLYLSAGYQEIRDLPDYYADGGDGIRYEIALGRGAETGGSGKGALKIRTCRGSF